MLKTILFKELRQ